MFLHYSVDYIAAVARKEEITSCELWNEPGKKLRLHVNDFESEGKGCHSVKKCHARKSLMGDEKVAPSKRDDWPPKKQSVTSSVMAPLSLNV